MLSAHDVGCLGVRLAVLLLIACRTPVEPVDVLIVSLDAVRADHLGAYGDTRSLTPALDRLAAESMVFTAAFTPEPWTLTAHATMLTGVHPSVHGLNVQRRLPADIPTLAEAFSRSGYTAKAIVADNRWMDPRYGQYRGFVSVVRTRDGDDAVAAILEHVDSATGPQLLFAHLYDAHSDVGRWPYEADAEDRAALGLPDVPPPCAPCGSQLLQAHNEGNALSADAISEVARGYAASIRSLDRRIDRLLVALAERGFLDRSVVVFTADHGEELAEHGRLLHQQFFDEVTHVPLLVRLPQPRPGRCAALISLVDLAPTTAALAGVDFAPEDGRSAADLVQSCGSADQFRDAVLFDTRVGLVGLRTRSHSLIGHGAKWRLHDLVSDPGQTANINDTPAGVAVTRELRGALVAEQARLAALRARFGTAAQLAGLGEEERRRLEALGYVVP